MAEPRAYEPAILITEHDHVQGETAPPVTLVEYGDFECPYSREAVKTIQVLQREFGHDLRFVFRHFPLAHRHPHAYWPLTLLKLLPHKETSGRCMPCCLTINGNLNAAI